MDTIDKLAKWQQEIKDRYAQEEKKNNFYILLTLSEADELIQLLESARTSLPTGRKAFPEWLLDLE